jgi:uncharacterized protein (TIGR03086 family)
MRMRDLVRSHATACNEFAVIADHVSDWAAATPCTEWDARALVEHVIGFHEWLLLRPLGVRANRPRDDPAARWRATALALDTALAAEGVLDRATELPGGGESSARRMLPALTTDVLVHTWDLAQAAGLDDTLDAALCRDAYERVRDAPIGRESGMVGPEVPVAPNADVQTRLIAYYGRDPAWTPPRRA